MEELLAAEHDPLIAAFEALARRAPRRTLILSRSRRIVAEDLRSAARAAARQLPADLAPGALVGLHAPDGPSFCVGLLALLATRRVPILLPHALPRPELDEVVHALGAAAVFEAEDAAAGTAWTARRSSGDSVVDMPAVVKLTSGSSGTPRGIVVSTDALLADEEALSTTMGIGEEDRLLAAVPFSHSYGFASLVLPALVRGVPLVVGGEHGPVSLLADAGACGATVFPTVPAVLRALVELAEPPALPDSIRLVLSAGSPLDPDVARRFRLRHGRGVHAFYGASECGGISFDREGLAAERGTVGAPVDGVRVTLEPVEGEAPADAGRVVVCSPAAGARYLPDAEPARLGGGKFRSDDLAVWDRDELVIVDRLGDMIAVRGRKVRPAEVERVLLRHPGVREARVVGVHSPSGSQVVRAVVACDAGIAAVELIAWCRARLAEHKVPRSVVLVDRIPRTERGKVDREALLRAID